VAFRILWHDGWPYPVSGHPFGPHQHDDSWFIQTRDGVWHAVVRRRREVSLEEAWPDIEAAMRRWLTAAASAADDESPPKVSVQVRLRPPASGLAQLRPVLAGIVNTERGQCYVELETVTRLPRPRTKDVAKHAESRQSAVFNVSFRTTNHPQGVHFEFDAMDFLEAVVQEYLNRRPEELPLARLPA